MKFLNKDVALCLVPHPDDTALSMGGLVKQYKDTTFCMLYLSAGTATDTTAGDQRFLEDRQFWKDFGVSNIIFEYIKGCTFDKSSISEWVTNIESKNISCDLIFSSPKTDSHYEHVLTNTFMYPLSRFKPLTLIEYKCTSTLHDWTPNMFVELSDDLLDFKIKCLRNSFPTQTDASYFTEENLKLFHMDYISRKRNYGYCETFKINQLYL